MRRAPAAFTLAVAAICALVAGCGDKAKSSGSVTVDAGKPVEVKADEYSFNPATITVRTGGRRGVVPVTFRLKNEGSLPHDISVRQGSAERGGTQAVGGGKTAVSTVALRPGEYVIFCSIGDHEKLGMKGALHVE